VASSLSQRRSLDALPDVLSVSEVAEALGVGSSTVRRWISVGELAPLPLSGDRLLVPKVQLLELIEKAGSGRRRYGATP
jgi:excisionase family DNA binding protein